MKTEKREARFGVGVPSLILIFTVLCLTTLGVLTLTAGRADLNITKRSTEMTVGYYRAAARAQALLSQADARMLSDESGSALAAWAEEQGFSLEGTLLSFFVDAGAERRLRLEVEWTRNAESRYSIRVHALEGATVLPEENALDLYP